MAAMMTSRTKKVEINHEQSFEKIHSDRIRVLHDELDTKLSRESHKKEAVVLKDLFDDVSFRRENLVKRLEPYDYRLRSHSVKGNAFKEELVSKFQHHKNDYEGTPVIHFINEHLEGLTKVHKSRFEQHPEQYEDDVDFLHKTEAESVVRLLAEDSAYAYFLDKINDVNPQGRPSEHEELEWKGANQTEFTQLIYALYHSKLLTNKSKRLIRLVEDLAKLFNVDLSQNWQSNLSKSVHQRNNDYEPEIFDRLGEAYRVYRKKAKMRGQKKGPQKI